MIKRLKAQIQIKNEFDLKMMMLRLLLLCGFLIYPPWSLLLQYLDETVYDPFIQRFSVGIFYLILCSLTFSKKVHNHTRIIHIVAVYTMLGHFYFLLYMNYNSFIYHQTTYITVLCLIPSYLLMKMSDLLKLYVYVIFLSVTVIIIKGPTTPTLCLFAGLATLFIVHFISMTFQLYLRNQAKDERKKYEALSETSQDIIVTTNIENEINYINKAGINLSGIKKEKLLNQNINALLIGVNCDEITSHEITNVKMNVKNMEPLTLEINATDIHKNDIKNGILITGRDISSRIKMEREREEMQSKVFQSSKLASIGTLAAGVGHEINNPLAIIQGNLDFLRRHFQENEINIDFITKVIIKQELAIKRISNIVNGLRNYSRLDTDDDKHVNMHSIITESINLVKAIYSKDNVIFKKELNGTEPIILGNKGRLQQVLMNLFSNAKDAMEESDEKTITVTTSNTDEKIKISIADAGCGIPKEKCDVIFDLFYTTKELGRGTGLGLGISHDIIKQMGGSIEVESKSEIGTTFNIWLPISIQIEIEKSEYQIANENIEMFTGTALIVDDEKDIIDILETQLVELGMEVTTADDGDTAIEKIKEFEFDYVFTDLQMPRMSGKELLKEAQKLKNRSTKFIILTGGTMGDKTLKEKEQLKKLSDGFIMKPFATNDLSRTLKKIGAKRKKKPV